MKRAVVLAHFSGLSRDAVNIRGVDTDIDKVSARHRR